MIFLLVLGIDSVCKMTLLLPVWTSPTSHKGGRILCSRAALSTQRLSVSFAATAEATQSEIVSFGEWTSRAETYDVRAPAVDRPNRPGAKELRVLRNLLQTDEVSEVLSAADVVVFEDEAKGSKNPVQTPVVVLKKQGHWVSGLARLQKALEVAVEQRVIPYMREVYGDPSLVAAEVLLRRYTPSEKPEHALHFDHHAAATCVVDFHPRPGSGLFVQPGPSAASRMFVPMHEAGDAVIHGWDVFHGVALQNGHERVSLIVWAKPQADAVGGRTSWYRHLGSQGDVDAAYRLGMEAEGQRDSSTAVNWYKIAADKGHWMAMSRLGRILMAHDAAAGISWTEKSAACGWAEAQVDIGDIQQRQGKHAAAVAAYKEAASQNHPGGLHRLGLANLRGLGAAVDQAVAREMLEASARLGWADAQVLLAQTSSFVMDDVTRSKWLSAAAAQGHPGAVNSLAIAAAKEGRNVEARELLSVAAQKGHQKAMINLALFFRKGVGGPADIAAAEQWEARARGAQPR